jgi:hypothetical protein
VADDVADVDGEGEVVGDDELEPEPDEQAAARSVNVTAPVTLASRRRGMRRYKRFMAPSLRT